MQAERGSRKGGMVVISLWPSAYTCKRRNAHEKGRRPQNLAEEIIKGKERDKISIESYQVYVEHIN